MLDIDDASRHNGTMTHTDLPQRRIVKTFTTNRQDPTAATELSCGHVTI